MKQPSILQEIIGHKLVEVAGRKSRNSLADLLAKLPGASPRRPFVEAMKARMLRSEPAVIAEVKKASPSKGLIRADFDPAWLAANYEEHGATCLSVLTDEKYFQGCDAYMQQARAACELPVLRKDFMVDPWQIVESRVLGADCVLLIVAALEQARLMEMADCCRETGIDVLVEVHDEAELERALELDVDLIGINNRNLHDFVTDLDTSLRLARRIPADKLIVTESGINTAEEVKRMLDNGIYGFLVGESFMRAADPGRQLRQTVFGHDTAANSSA